MNIIQVTLKVFKFELNEKKPMKLKDLLNF